MQNYKTYIRLAEKLDNLNDFLLILPNGSYSTGPSNGVISSSDPKQLSGKTSVRFRDKDDFYCRIVFNNKTGKVVKQECTKEHVSDREAEALTGYTFEERTSMSSEFIVKSRLPKKKLDRYLEMSSKIRTLEESRKSILEALKKDYTEVEFMFTSTKVKGGVEVETIPTIESIDDTLKSKIIKQIEVWTPEMLDQTSDHFIETILDLLEEQEFDIPDGKIGNKLDKEVMKLSKKYHTQKSNKDKIILEVVNVFLNPKNYS